MTTNRDTWNRQFKTLTKIIGEDPLIIGGSCARAYYDKPCRSDVDIDVWVPKDYDFGTLYRNSECYLLDSFEREYEFKGCIGRQRYFIPEVHKIVDFVVHVENNKLEAMHIAASFDINKSRYYYNSGLNSVCCLDSYPTEIAIQNIENGTQFGSVFDRVAKYRKIFAEEKFPVVFRLD